MTSPLKHAAVLERAEAHHGKFAAFAGAKPIHTEIVEACVAGASALRAQAEVPDTRELERALNQKPLCHVCTHGIGWHVDGSGKCRNGCACKAFVSLPAPAPDEALRAALRRWCIVQLSADGHMRCKQCRAEWFGVGSIEVHATGCIAALVAPHPEPRTPEAEALREAKAKCFDLERVSVIEEGDCVELGHSKWHEKPCRVCKAKGGAWVAVQALEAGQPFPTLTPDAQLMAAYAKFASLYAGWNVHKEDKRDVDDALATVRALEAQVKP